MAEQRTLPYLFISYASSDRERVMPVVDALRQAGVPVWVDQASIAGGENYGLEITEAIEHAAGLVLMCSAISLASRNVKQEIALAWKFERPYLPLLLESVDIPKDVLYWLEAAQWIEVLDKPEAHWLPSVLAALAPLGIAPAAPQHEEVRLAGREREQTLLREKLTDAQERKGGLVLIGGEAGVGKTTLAEAALRKAAGHGFVILEGHCFDLAETPPYGLWIDLFLRFPLVPGHPPLPPAFTERGTVGAVSSQIALFAQVQDFLDALLARQPVVMLLDDLHWSDPASLDLLRFLARSVATRSLLILVTYRADELTRRHPLYALLPQLAREAGAERLDLHRLDDDAVRALVTERYPLPDEATARLATYLQSRAEGNALFVGELLRSLVEAGVLRQEGDAWRLGDLTRTAIPALLRQVIDGRLARLDDESQRVLAVAAVMGHAVSLAVWATVAEVDDDVLLAVAEEGLAARVLVEGASGESVRFAHALIRESLFEGIPTIRRRRVHRRIGEAMASEHAPDPDAVAYHFQQAGDHRAAAWLVMAGERAQAAFAWPTAVARYEEALAHEEGMDERERGWLLYRIACLLRHTDRERGLRHAREAAGVASATGDRALTASVTYVQGHMLSLRGDSAGVALITAVVPLLDALTAEECAQIDRQDRTVTVTHMRGMAINQAAAMGHFAEARAAIAGAPVTDVPPGISTAGLGEEPWRAIGSMGYAGLAGWHAYLGRYTEAREAYTRAYRLADAQHDIINGWLIRFVLADMMLRYAADRPDAIRVILEEAEAVHARAAGTVTEERRGMARALLDAVQGRWDAAERILESAPRLPVWWTRALRPYGDLKRARGEGEAVWAEVRQALPEGLASAHGTLHFRRAQEALLMGGGLLLDAGDGERAKGWLDALDRWLAWSGSVIGRSEGQMLWARYHRQAGDMDKAWEHAERALALATEPRQPLALLAAHRLLGALDTEARQYDEAATHLDTSLALADACQAPYERALTLLAMAQLRAATGGKDAARALLDEVRAICEPLGAKPTLARAAALAAKTGAE